MRPINHILLELADQTIGSTTQQLKNGLYINFTYHPQDWVPSYGVVVVSSFPEIRPGDTAYVDYYSVLMALGIRYNTEQRAGMDKKYIEDNGKILVFLRPSSVFFVVRDEKLIPVNGNEIIVPEFVTISSALEVGKKSSNICSVLTGEYVGKRVVYRPQRVRNCGQYGYNSKDFYIIHKDYLLAEVE